MRAYADDTLQLYLHCCLDDTLLHIVIQLLQLSHGWRSALTMSAAEWPPTV